MPLWRPSPLGPRLRIADGQDLFWRGRGTPMNQPRSPLLVPRERSSRPSFLEKSINPKLSRRRLEAYPIIEVKLFPAKERKG